jgi:hypothetical protein
MFKHIAFQKILDGQTSGIQRNFSASAYFEGLYDTSFTSALWIFALKFWALSIRLKALFEQGNPDELKTFIRFLYLSGIFVSLSFGVGLTVSGLFYYRGKTAAKALYVLNTVFQFLSCFVMFDAFRRLSSIVKATTQFIVNFRVLMLYLTSSILLAVSCIMTTFS